MTDIAALVADNIHVWTGAIQRKSGAGRGGGKRISLYGIERLRALILDLAVRGRLVPQNGEASDTLRSITVERKNMAAEKLIRIKKRNKSSTAPVAPFAIPSSWHWVELAELCGLENGDRGREYPNKSALKPSGVPFVNAGHLQKGVVDKSQMTFISEDHYERLGGGKFRDGDILYCLRGSLGKAAQVSGIGRGAIASSLVIIRLAPSFIGPFMMIYLGTSLAMAMVRRYDNGTAQPNLSSANLEKFLVPVPPLAEQQRIVAKVDELMALCDALERESADAMAAHQALVEALLATLVNSADAADLARQWARLESHFDILFITDASIDALKQTILDLAVRGKLVEQDAGDETAGRKGDAKNAQLTPPFAIPQSWQCLALKSLGRQVGGGTPSKSRMDFWDGPIPWISPKDMKRDYLSEAELNVSEAALQSSSIKMIAPESLLFVVRGMILAHSFPVAIAQAPVTINQDMKAIELYEPEMAEYLLRALKGLKPLMLARVERSSHGTCRLDSTAYGDFPIPIPPRAEQRRIVAKVDGLMALCDALKARLADAAQAQRHLADAITERAAA